MYVLKLYYLLEKNVKSSNKIEYLLSKLIYLSKTKLMFKKTL